MNNLDTKYRELSCQLDDIFYEMQTYILENYQKVPMEVWNQSTYAIKPHMGKDILYFGKKSEYVPRKKQDELFKKLYDRKIKIDSIEFRRDEIDDEFSIDFNGGNWCFLWEDMIVPYYRTIFNYLKDE